MEMIGPGAILLVFIFVGLFVFLLPVMALISILKNRFNDNDKLIWVLIVLLLPILGSILYFIIGRHQRLN